MKSVYWILHEMLGEEQAKMMIASSKGRTIDIELQRVNALIYVIGLLTVEEAGKMV